MRVLSLFDGMSCGRLALHRAGIPVSQYIASEIDKYAIQVARANWSDIIHLGDVRVVRQMAEAGVFGRVDLLIGGSPCFVAGTKVITDVGFKNIEDVCINDSVLSHYGTWDKVLDVGGKTSGTVSVKVQGILDTFTTPEHPYYVRKSFWVWDSEKRSSVRTFTKPEWLEAYKMGKGYFAALPILQTRSNPFNLSNEECFVLGRYIADGHTRKDFRTSENRPNHRHWQMILSVGSHKIPSLEISHSCYAHGKSTHRVVVSNKRLVQIAEAHCGVGASEKYISQMLLDLPVPKLKRVIDGLISGDGYVRKDHYKICTVSEMLARTLPLAVAKCYGTGCSVLFTKRKAQTVIEGRTVNQRSTWEIYFHKIKKKQANYWSDGEFIWLPVKDVSLTGKTEKVYNLEVERSNSYTANNLVVHNCQGFSFAGKQLAFDDPRSALFFEYVHILYALRKQNPSMRFMLENVKMKKEHLAVITGFLGVEPVLINSALVSAQNRQRYYWCNWKVEQPADRGLLLRDIIETGEVDRDKSYCIDANYYKGGSLNNYLEKSRRQIVLSPEKLVNVNPSGNGMNGWVYGVDAKSPTVTTNKGEGSKIAFHQSEKRLMVKENDNRAIAGIVMTENGIRPYKNDGRKGSLTEIGTIGLADTKSAAVTVANAPKYTDRHIRNMKSLDDKSVKLLSSMHKGQQANGQTLILDVTGAAIRGRYIEGNSGTTEQGLEVRDDGKANSLTTVGKDSVLAEGITYRKLTPIECERLQGVPDNYTNHVSSTQRYRMLGNGWQVDTIEHIFRSMPI